MLPYPRSAFHAWVDSAYGVGGFWNEHLPSHHFRTAATTGGVLAEVVEGVLDQHPQLTSVVDVGAGGGELLAELACRRPGLRLGGVDLRTRPVGLDSRIGWARDLWDVSQHAWTSGGLTQLLALLPGPTLFVATEWLDDLPCCWARWQRGGWCEVMVGEDGRPYAGPPLPDAESAWARRWWPAGERAEIGLTRDRAWAGLVSSALATGGSALLVDYGHDSANRPAGGSLAGYRLGRPQPPSLDRGANLTAHVALDSVQAAGEAAGAQTLVVSTLAELSRARDHAAPAPSAEENPLAALVTRSHRSALSSPRIWGGFRALLQA